jgi:membrane dipeptidase
MDFTEEACYAVPMEKNPDIERCRRRALDALKPTAAQLERGLELHRACVVVDAFGFAPGPMTAGIVRELNAAAAAGATPGGLAEMLADLRAREPEAVAQYLEAWEASGVTGVIQNAGVTAGGGLSAHALRFLDLFRRVAPRVAQARNPEEILAAKRRGRHAVVFSYNSVPHGPLAGAEEAAAPLRTAWEAGVRMMHLAYNRRNLIADGCMERADAGLSEFGFDILRRMNEIGILVDAAHTGRRSTLDAARASTRPIVASHTGCRAVYDHPRNKTDQELRAVADTGGFVGIYQPASFLGRKADLNTWLDHVAHAVRVAGAEHVAVASDTGYIAPFPPGCAPCTALRDLAHPWVRAMAAARGEPGVGPAPLPYSGAWKPEHGMDASDDERTGSLTWTNWPLFTVGLVTRGYSDAEIEKIIGGNALRVLETACPDEKNL